METNEKQPGDKKWNNTQVNEGFSGQNLPEGYNDQNPRMTTEVETDESGNETQVKRARFPHQQDDASVFDAPVDNSVIENKKSLEHRDRNYDIARNRYPNSHPESHRDRGNMKLDE